jgi:glyoxylase-like metal-dependent hydrolase (beta-lactamase superfamily II)
MAVAVSLAGLGVPAAAQVKPAEPPVPATTFNAATDKLDRTTAGPITRPMIIEIANNTYFLNEFGMDAQYLLVGATRALLIDTGSGFYDLKGTVEKLTKLPYDVAVTHGHPDHAGGIGQFDTVYMHPADIPMLKSISQQSEKQYGEIMWGMPIGYPHVWGYTPADARWGGWQKQPVIKPLFDGQEFDLGGGRVVTVYHIPGHTAGSCVFLDRKERILFSGDAGNRNPNANAVPVSTYLRNLLKLQKLRTEYDRNYNGHTAYAGTLDALPQAPEVLDDVIEAYRSVLRGNPTLEVVHNHLFPERTSTVAVYGQAIVGFDPQRLWEPNEPHVVP